MPLVLVLPRVIKGSMIIVVTKTSLIRRNKFVFTLTHRASTIPNNICGVTNPVRGLVCWAGKREDHLESFNESMKLKGKTKASQVKEI